MDVQWGDHACLFTRWSLAIVTRERFVARSSGREATGAIDEWGDWLRHLREEGRLFVHWPGCSIGWCSCDQTAEPGLRLEVIK